MRILFIGLLLFLMAPFLNAETESRAGSNINSFVKWNELEYFEIKEPNRVRIKFSGVTVPDTEINLDVSSTHTDISKKTGPLDLSEIHRDYRLPTKSDSETGEFSATLDLPYGIVKLVFNFKYPNEIAKSHTINIETYSTGYRLKTPIESDKLLVVNKHSLWLATGVNYTSYKQKVNGSSNSIDFNSIKAPSTYFEGRISFSPNLKALLAVKNTLGEIGGTESLNFSSSSYNWQATTIEAIVSQKKWKAKVSKWKTFFSFRTGLSENRFPILYQDQSGKYSMETLSANMLSVGAEADVLINPNLNFEIFLRDQIFLNTKNFRPKNPFAFDGSLGLLMGINKSIAIGVYWYGQYQTYAYTLDESLGAKNSTGSQSMLYSNMELRLVNSF